jgi:hypothetical protein
MYLPNWEDGKVRLIKSDNHFMHGAAIGMAFLPYAIVGTFSWPGILIRVVVLTLGMGIWSKLIGHDVTEEAGRGFLITATLPLLWI